MTAAKKDSHGSEKRQRTEQHRIRLTPAEKVDLIARADGSELSVAAYVRHQILGAPGARSVRRLPVDTVVVRQLIGQLGAIGNNLNQLTRLANIGDLERPSDLAPVLAKVNDTLDACLEALGKTP